MMVLIFTVLAILFLLGAGFLFWEIEQQKRSQSYYLNQRLGGSRTDAPTRFQQSDPLTRLLQGFVLRAGVDLEHLPRWFGPASIMALVGVLILGLALGVVMAMLGLLLYGVLVMLWALAREMRRQTRMREQLPDFLEHMMRVLNAGNSLEEALATATAECPEPLSEVFQRVNRQVRLGAPIEDTLTEVSQLSGMRELQVMALATRINRRFGGSLKRIFKSLVAAIHQQDAARREMRALTAETRFSAVVLAVVPMGMMAYILAQNPDYYREMWNDAGGQMLLIAAVVLQIIGVIVIWRMVNRAGREVG